MSQEVLEKYILKGDPYWIPSNGSSYIIAENTASQDGLSYDGSMVDLKMFEWLLQST